MSLLKSIKILILIQFLSIEISNAQNGEVSKAGEYNNNSYLTINLLSSLSPIVPRWRVGYIKNINEMWKVGVDVGYGNPSLTYHNLGDNYEDNYELWEIRPEFYYFLKAKKKAKITYAYLSTELFYINHSDVFSNGHYFPMNGESFRYDQANFRRQKYGLNLKYGFFFYSKKRIGLNAYTGLGLRIRNNTFSEILNPTEVDLGPEGGDMFGFDAYKNMEGTNWSANFVFGFKLYYRLEN